MRNRTFRDLLVWQQAMDLAIEIYGVTCAFPTNEEYGLTSQLRRAAVSIPSNIAEGSGRGSDRDQSAFIRVALGSLRELDTQLEIAARLTYLSEDVRAELIIRIVSIEKLLLRLPHSLAP